MYFFNGNNESQTIEAPHGSTPDTPLLSVLVTLRGLSTASSSSRPQCRAPQSPQTPSPGEPQNGSLLSAQVAKREGTRALPRPGPCTQCPLHGDPSPRCPRWALSAATQTSFPRQQSEAHPELRSHSHAKPRKISNKRHPPSTSLGQGSYSGVPEVRTRAPGLPALDTALHKAPGCCPLWAASGQKGQDTHITPSKKTPLHSPASLGLLLLLTAQGYLDAFGDQCCALKSFPRRGPPGCPKFTSIPSTGPSSKKSSPLSSLGASCGVGLVLEAD